MSSLGLIKILENYPQVRKGSFLGAEIDWSRGRGLSGLGEPLPPPGRATSCNYTLRVGVKSQFLKFLRPAANITLGVLCGCTFAGLSAPPPAKCPLGRRAEFWRGSLRTDSFLREIPVDPFWACRMWGHSGGTLKGSSPATFPVPVGQTHTGVGRRAGHWHLSQGHLTCHGLHLHQVAKAAPLRL